MPTSDWSRGFCARMKADTSSFWLRTCGDTTVWNRCPTFCRRLCACDTIIALSPSPPSIRHEISSRMIWTRVLMGGSGHQPGLQSLPPDLIRWSWSGLTRPSLLFRRLVQRRLEIAVETEIGQPMQECRRHAAHFVLADQPAVRTLA